MNEQDLKKIFAAHKVDISDEGFSERLIGLLPERKSMLPQIIIVVFLVIGLVLVFAVLGFVPVLEQIHDMVVSISRNQMPSLISIITYISVLAITGTIGYSAVQANEYS